MSYILLEYGSDKFDNGIPIASFSDMTSLEAFCRAAGYTPKEHGLVKPLDNAVTYDAMSYGGRFFSYAQVRHNPADRQEFEACMLTRAQAVALTKLTRQEREALRALWRSDKPSFNNV